MNDFKYSCKRQSNVGQTDPELTQWCNDNEDRYTLYIDNIHAGYEPFSYATFTFYTLLIKLLQKKSNCFL